MRKASNSARVLANGLGCYMDNGDRSAQIVRFGLFEADLQTGELRKNGAKSALAGPAVSGMRHPADTLG